MSRWELLLSSSGFAGKPDRVAVIAKLIRDNDFVRWSELAVAVDVSEWSGIDSLSADEIAFLRRFAKLAPKRFGSCCLRVCRSMLLARVLSLSTGKRRRVVLAFDRVGFK